jgi:hypothetical protein
MVKLTACRRDDVVASFVKARPPSAEKDTISKVLLVAASEIGSSGYIP